MPLEPKFYKLNHSIYASHYHLVLTAKYRRKVINGPILARIEQLVRKRSEDWGGELLEMNGEADHVHFLSSLPPTMDLTKFINNVKTTYSRVIRNEFSDHVSKFYWKSVFWSRTYCLVSCGGAPFSIIKQYIENQDQPD
ncbi:IS200/IS605 family transposase [Sulfitobacter sp. R18_1]|uniref:IS200/IS605 family transposase n=1 Tax=Sulfitobacter sp. R18_1 TaxID=2821104 RepID=UPI001FFE260E|nr:IS200/IS605 family transposase [Sulfitobacter sp. R18_1]